MSAGPRQQAFNAALAGADPELPIFASQDWRQAGEALDTVASRLRQLVPEIRRDFEGATGTKVAEAFDRSSVSMSDKSDRFLKAYRALESAAGALEHARTVDRELTKESESTAADPTAATATGGASGPDPVREQRAADAYRVLDSAMADYAREMRAVHTDPAPASPDGGGSSTNHGGGAPHTGAGGTGPRGSHAISLTPLGDGSGADGSSGEGSSGSDLAPILLPEDPPNSDETSGDSHGGTTQDAWHGFGDTGGDTGGSGVHPAVIGGGGAAALGALGVAGMIRGGGGTSTTAVAGGTGRGSTTGPLGGRANGGPSVLGRGTPGTSGGAASAGSPTSRNQGSTRGTGGGRGAGSTGRAGGRGAATGSAGSAGGRGGRGSRKGENDAAPDHEHYDIDEDWTDDEGAPVVIDSAVSQRQRQIPDAPAPAEAPRPPRALGSSGRR